MSSFDQAIPVIMAHEGTPTNFWVDDPDDPGGETVWGWSMLTIQRLGLTPRDLGLNQDVFTPGCLKEVSKAVCEHLYFRFFWLRYNLGLVSDQTAATKMMDAAVNMGPARAVKFAQSACNRLGHPTEVDGQLGKQTAASINTCDPAEFVRAYRDEMKAYYLSIIAKSPKLAKFQKNWLRRAEWGVVGP